MLTVQLEAAKERWDAGLCLVGDDLPRGQGEVVPQLQGSAAAPLPFSWMRTQLRLSICRGTKKPQACQMQEGAGAKSTRQLSEGVQRGEGTLHLKARRLKAIRAGGKAALTWLLQSQF